MNKSYLFVLIFPLIVLTSCETSKNLLSTKNGNSEEGPYISEDTLNRHGSAGGRHPSSGTGQATSGGSFFTRIFGRGSSGSGANSRTNADQGKSTANFTGSSQSRLTPGSSWYSAAAEAINNDAETFFGKEIADIKSLCPNFYSARMSKRDKTDVLVAIVDGIVMAESDYNASKSYYERSHGYYSYGLMALSTVNKSHGGYCSGAGSVSSLKTGTFSIKCGTQILAKQLRVRGRLFDGTYYWSTLGRGSGRHSVFRGRINLAKQEGRWPKACGSNY